MSAPVYQKALGVTLELWIPNKEKPASVFNFQEAGFSPRVAKSLVRAFVSLNGANTLESQRASWVLIQRFGRFALETFGRVDRLPRESLHGFDAWLLQKKFSGKSVGATLNAVIRHLRWCLRNAPKAVNPRIELARTPYAARVQRAEAPTDAAVPDEELIRRILVACRQEIETVKERMIAIRSLAQSSGKNNLADLLKQLLKIGNGSLPSQKQLLSAPRGQMILLETRQYGRLRGIQAEYYLNIDDLFPFYLAILVQTSGNPVSLLRARRNCFMDVPLRPDLERMVWDKERAGREQAIDFPKDKTWSAPNVARMLQSLNEELREFASAEDSDALFLCRNHHSRVTRPSWQALHNAFREFRRRNDLPKFDLKSLRKAGARLHHRAARSLAAAKHRLQHADERTTEKYTPLSDRREQHDKVILRFQGVLMSSILKYESPKKGGLKSKHPVLAPAETLFGFGCKDPLSGVAPGSKSGETCLLFFQCATCPGAIIVVDDPACVARLLRSHDQLLQEHSRALKEGWSARFEQMYGPTLSILRSSVLPAISSHTLEKARELKCPPLPRLE